MRAAVCKTLIVSVMQSLTEMERPRNAFVVFMCVLVFIQMRVYGAEVEMKVRPGDNITLYCDRTVTIGFRFVWIRNSSHENQPSLVIDFRKWDLEIFKHFSFVHNRSSNSHDLHITNISVSDLGLYYCAEVENKVIYNKEKGIISSSEVYYYGNRTTRLSFAEKVTLYSGPSNITSTLPLSDCVLCWTLLFSVCPVCVLLSSLLSSMCVYCLCRAQTAGSESAEILTANLIKGDPPEKHQCETSKTEICLHTEVSYRLLTSSYPYAKM